jgi:prophage regulatory protein
METTETRKLSKVPEALRSNRYAGLFLCLRSASSKEIEMRENLQTSVALWRFKTVSEKTGFKRSALYKSMADGDFPKPVKITAKAVAWPSNRVEDWIDKKIAEGRQSSQASKHADALAGDKSRPSDQDQPSLLTTLNHKLKK